MSALGEHPREGGLERRLAQRPEEYTPWLQQEWATLRERHANELPAGAGRQQS